jgi:peptidoglycan/xylan/chitin deacetylase (PgdA/CDA1 family)
MLSMFLDMHHNSSQTDANAGFSRAVGLKKLCSGLIARGLYHSRMLFLARSLARSYSFRRNPSAGFPRLCLDSRAKFGILCYHSVGFGGVPVYSQLHPKKFEAQMRYLKQHYRIIPMRQLCRELREAHDVPPTLAITFDDGYRDVYNHAFPVLRKYSIPATVYLIGRCMETGEAPWYDRIFLALQTARDSTLEVDLEYPRRFELASSFDRLAAAWEIVCFLKSIPEPRRRAMCVEMEHRLPVPEVELAERMLNWKHVCEMHRGGVEFGAHTMTHPAVSRLQSSDFSEELARSKLLLEKGLGAPIEDFAYPFGKLEDMSEAAESFLRACGYRSAATTIEGFNSTGANPFALRRIQIGDDSSLASFSFRICRKFLEGQEESRSAELSLSKFPDAASPRIEREGI